ncbi:MAG: hypothetical protein ACOCYB_00760, partial [Alkalispirochaeta sp.]
MERNLRIVAPIGGGAAVVSLLVGLLAGVPFGTAVIRAVLSGGGFSLLVLGLMVVVRARLPGFDHAFEAPPKGSDRSGSDPNHASDASSGSRLNIVVEDDGESESPSRSSERSDSDDGSAPEEATAAGVSAEDGATVEDVSTPEETLNRPDSSPGGDADTVQAEHWDDSPPDEDEETAELVEEVEESSADDEEAVMRAAISEEQDGASVEIDDTMLDEMPDIGKYSSSFVSGGDIDSNGVESPGSAGESSGFSGGSKQKAGDPRKGHDNKTVAKALQTLLAKDNE